jgi:FG-GAP-like repeat/FG-GAP repeat
MMAISPRIAAPVASLTLILSGAGAALAQSLGDTTDLKTTYVQRLDGAHTGDDAGDRVASAGDVNRDGREDLIVGAYTADAPGRENAGAAYIVRSSAAKRVMLGSGTAGIVVLRGGRTDDKIGQMVAGVGDVNGDGRPDQAVGSYGVAARGRPKAGSIWVVLTTAGKRVINVRKPATGLVRIDGSEEEAELDPAASAGDFNGDGIGDLVVGETDAAYVILGRSNLRAIDLANPGANVLRIAPDGQESLGIRVAGVGDVNGDGLSDVAVGYVGGAVVVFGRKDVSKDVDAGAAGSGSYDIGAGGGDPPDSFGDAVAGVGDVNGDGLADVAVSASNASAQGQRRAGVVAIYYGKAGPEAQAWPPPAGQGMRILGAGNDDRAGYTIAGPGDLDGDGRPEIVVGAFLAGGLGRVDAGATYRVSPPVGGADVHLASLGANVKRWVGSRTQEQSGYAVDSADVDGDGSREVVIGAGFASFRGRHSGSVYVVGAR